MIRRRRTILTLSLGTSSCSGLPLSYLDSTAPVGGKLAELGWGLLAVSVIVVVIISALMIAAVLVCGLACALYPQEFRHFLLRLRADTRSAVISTIGAARAAIPPDDTRPQSASR